MENFISRKNGITLISLVITIVILLILTGVAIKLAVDSNGIFDKAGNAKNLWNNSVVQEGSIIKNLFANSGILEENLSLEEKIKKEQNENTLTFMFSSDIHYNMELANSENKINDIHIMGNLADKCNASFIAINGDCIEGKQNKQQSINNLTKLVTETRNSTTVPTFFIRGNHDDNGWYSSTGQATLQKDEIINDIEWNQIVQKGGDIVTDTNNPNGGYFYYDDEKSKIRIFMLNTEDIPYYEAYTPVIRDLLSNINWDNGQYFIKNGEEYVSINKAQYDEYAEKPQLYLYSYRYSSFGNGHAFRNEQLNFVAQNLYNLNSDWSALFLMHVPLDTSKKSGELFGIKDALIRNHDILLAIITAYKNGTKCILSGDGGYTTDVNFLDEANDFAYEVDIDYTNRGKGEVIAFISGHTHWNNTSDEVGVRNSLSYGFRYISIAADGFSTIIVNREESKISIFRYGNNYIPSNTNDQAGAEGVLEGSVESGSLQSGEYTVKYNQFYPEIKNLFNNNWNSTNQYYAGSNMSVNMNNYDVSLSDVFGDENYYTYLVAIPVRPYTTYTLGSTKKSMAFVGTITAINNAGKRSSDLTITKNEDGSSSITTGKTHYAIVIRCHKDYIEELMVVEGEKLPNSYIPFDE